MKLNELTLRPEYRSDESNLARDLYERCLPLSVRFDRAVGFFACSVFSSCPAGFRHFFQQHGVMRVVCSPVLDQNDIVSLVAGYRDRPKLRRQSTLDVLKGDRREIQSRSTELVGWLIASGRLDVRIAVRNSHSAGGLYHEKSGLFIDKEGDTIGFGGSANESFSGLEQNFESVDIFRSWEPSERRRVEQKAAHFEALWTNNTDGLEIYPFPLAARLGILQTREHSDGDTPTPISPISGLEETLGIPTDVALRDHQKAAVRTWFDHNGLGILEMATGAGKTIAALAIAAKLYESIGGPFLVIIVCPYIHLAEQWVEVATLFGLDPLICAISKAHWYDMLSTRLFNLASGRRHIASIVVSNATFASEVFQALLQRVPARTLIVADEVHNLGAHNLRQSLPTNVRYRVGLSATWKRARDPVGTAAIRDYFGGPVQTYTLAQALADRVLCPYRYHPILVKLDDDEFDAYLELTGRIAKLYQIDDGDNESPVLQALLIKRARLLATASQKIPTLIRLLSSRKETSHNLIYCGDGSVDTGIDAGIERQIEAVTRVVGRDLEMTVAKYVADTPLTARHDIRRRFASGKTQCLVAIKCLDEGVDIPETRRAFILASSTNPRQFIQRRGRILRRAPNKDMAEIFDFIVEPPSDVRGVDSPFYQVTRRLFRRELYRIMEFADLALNGPEAMHALLPLRDELGLLDFDKDDLDE